MKIHIAENIRNLRKKYNMKQEQLAEALDVSITAVSKWEREMATPELKYIVEMADLFEVSVDNLLGYNIQSGACEAWEKRIHELKLKKDFENAAIEAEKALVRYPNNFKLIIECAEVYQIKGLESGDKESLRRAIELWNKSLLLISQNQNEEISDFSIRAEIASCYITLGEKEKGIELLRKCNIGGIHNAIIGMIYAKVEEFPPEKSVPFLEKGFFSIMANLIQVMEGYVDYYVRLKNYKAALEAELWRVQYLESIGSEKNASIADKFLVSCYINCAWLVQLLGEKVLMEKYLKKTYYHATRFDRDPSYHVSDLKFYLGELKDGVVFESTGITAMDTVNQFMEEKLCDEEFQNLWKKIKGEESNETVE